MKKFVSIMLALAMSMSLAACGADSSSDASSDSQSSSDAASGEKVVAQQAVERPERLHVRVEVDAALGVEGVKADIVRREGPFALGDGFFDPFDGMDVEILPCPAFECVFRHAARPALHALL